MVSEVPDRAADRLATGGTSSDPYRPGYEVAAERILEYVAANGLAPGDRLPTELRLSADLGVSHSVTREAIKVLSALGRLSVRKGAGIFVGTAQGRSPLVALPAFLPADLDQVDMLFDYRRTIECEAARLAAIRATPREMRAIRRAATDGQDAAAVDDFAAFRVHDDAFHAGLGAAAHNMFIAASVDTVTALKHQVLALGLRGSASGSLTEAAAQHVRIADAIADGDATQAAVAAADHIAITRRQFHDQIIHHLMTASSAQDTGERTA